MAVGVAITWGYRVSRPDALSYELDFTNIPMQLAGFEGKAAPDDPAVAEYLEARAMRTIMYVRGDAGVNASLIYGPSWRTVHTPAACFPSQGWNVTWEHAVDVPIEGALPHPGPVTGELMRVDRGDDALMVLFVFAHLGGTAPDYVEHSLAVMSGPRGAGGLSLMATTRIGSRGIEAAHADLLDLVGALYPHAVSFWYETD